MTNLLFLTDRGQWHQAQAREAAPAEFDVTILRRPDRDALFAALAQVEVLITERTGDITAEMIAAAPDLRMIERLGSLTFDIDLEACRQRGIVVSRYPVFSSIHVAEHLFLLLLALMRRYDASRIIALAADHGIPGKRTDEDTFAYNWSGFTGIEGIFDKTFAILGMGEIGVEFARRVQPFLPARVLYNKRTRYPASVETELGLTYADTETCLREADIVLGLLPYAPETDMLVNAQAVTQMKPGSFFIHVGSGSTVDEYAILDALRDGHLAGAAFDTYEIEPLQPDHPLVAAAREGKLNLVLTPHVAAGTGRGGRHPRAWDFDECLRFIRNEPLRYRVI